MSLIGRALLLVSLTMFFIGCAGRQPQEANKEKDHRKSAESNTALGLEYMNRGQYEVALGKLKKALQEDQSYAPAHTVMAVLYERLGEDKLAGQHYQLAYEADPVDGDVNNNYGVYLCKSSEENNAMDHFLAALDDPFYNSPSVALTNAGSCALGRGQLTEAEGFLRRALKREPEFQDALINMARLNFEQQKYLKARAFMQRYEAVSSHSAESLLLAYKIETASGDRKAAQQYRRHLVTGFPKSEQASEVRGSTER